MAANFSDAIVNCYYFGHSVNTVFTKDIYSHNSFAMFTLAFIFNFMGKALTYRDIVN